MTNKSKAKGNAWEYAFADYLTVVFGRNFKRNTSGSGAQFGGGNFRLKLAGRDTTQVLAGLGDIVPPTGFYVVSECKNYAEFPFHQLLGGKAGKTILWDWIEEVRHDSRFDDSQNTHLPHWLSFKVTRRGEFLVLPEKYFGHIFKTDCPLKEHFVYTHEKLVNGDLLNLGQYYILPLSELPLIKDQVLKVISDQKYFSDNVMDLVQ